MSLLNQTDAFQLEGVDGKPFVARWEWDKTKPTRNRHGITGWATVNGEGQCRVHVCAHNPCTAMHAYNSKYGFMPVPTHGRRISSASSAVAAPLPLTVLGSAPSAVAAPPPATGPPIPIPLDLEAFGFGIDLTDDEEQDEEKNFEMAEDKKASSEMAVEDEKENSAVAVDNKENSEVAEDKEASSEMAVSDKAENCEMAVGKDEHCAVAASKEEPRFSKNTFPKTVFQKLFSRNCFSETVSKSCFPKTDCQRRFIMVFQRRFSKNTASARGRRSNARP